MPGGLPEVTQEWTASVEPYIAEMSKLIAVTREAASAVEDLQHTIDALHGKTVDLGVDTAAANAAAAVNDLAAAENDLAAAMWKPNAAGQFQIETSRLLAETDALLAGQSERLAAATAAQAAATAALAASERLTTVNTQALAEAVGIELTQAMARANADFARWDTYQKAVVATSKELSSEISSNLVDAMARAQAQFAQWDSYQKDVVASSEALTTAINSEGDSALRFRDILLSTTGATNQAAGAAGRAGGAWWGWWRALNATVPLFGGMLPGILGGIAAWHLLADVIAEVAAVIIPAGIALAAFGVAAAPTIGDIVTRMQNLVTVTQATSQNLYPLTGTFQRMADAVQPQVYQLFGEALNVATAKAGAFTQMAKQTGTVLDQLGARLEMAIQSGGFQVFLAHAVQDVAKLGDIVGNVGGIIGNLLRTIPGYAQYLLTFADGVTKAGEAFTGSGLVQGVLQFGLAAHGAIIYGGLLATGISMLLTGVGRFPGLLSLASDGLGVAALGMEKLAGEGNVATRVLGSMSSEVSLMQGWNWGWITLGVAAVAALTYAFVSARDSADTFIASFNAGLAATPITQLGTRLSEGINIMSGSMVSAQARVNTLSGGMQAFGKVIAPVAPGIADVNKGLTDFITHVPGLNEGLGLLTGHLHGFVQATNDSGVQAGLAVHDYQAYQAEVATLTQQSITFHQRLGELAVAFGGTAAAMGILTAAGITSSQMMNSSGKVWAQIITQVNATISAYRAMGQAGGVLGADMNAMTIASSDQVQSMSKLNQAFDTTIGIVSNGQSAFINFEQAVGKGSSSIAGVATAAKVAGASMTGLNTQSLALRGAWQGAYTSGSQVVDALRMMIAVSPNAASQNANLTRSVKDVVAQLAVEGGKSAATRAELVSLAQEVNPAIRNFSELKTWLGNTGNAAQDLQKRLSNMGVNIQNLAADANHLSGVMQSQITSSFSAAKLQANGTDTAITNLANAIGHNANAATVSRAALSLFSVLVHQDGMSASAAKALVDALTGSIIRIPAGHHTTITTNAAQVIGNMASVQGAINALHGKTITITTIENVISNTTILQHVVSASGAHSGFQHGGVIPGYQPGVDSVHAMLSPGEGILNPYAVRMLGAGWVHAVNRIAEHGGGVNPAALRAGVSGPGGGGGAAVIHNHIILDGKEIAASVRRADYAWSTRNSGVRSGLNIPGTRIG